MQTKIVKSTLLHFTTPIEENRGLKIAYMQYVTKGYAVRSSIISLKKSVPAHITWHFLIPTDKGMRIL